MAKSIGPRVCGPNAGIGAVAVAVSFSVAIAGVGVDFAATAQKLGQHILKNIYFFYFYNRLHDSMRTMRCSNDLEYAHRR